MLEFIQLLKQRYQTVLTQLDKKSSRHFDYLQRFEQLLYAEAYIRKGQLIAEKPGFPLQIAVIGPTQAGKSTVVNLLLNASRAGVSPLAGYTQHAQGFLHRLELCDTDGLQQFFGRFERLDVNKLHPSRHDCYATSSSASTSHLIPPCVIWDTPDFDSIDAADYREGLIRAIALADVIVLVVSKEKYADQSVWEVMQTVAHFDQPTLICLNKLAEGNERLIQDSLQQKWQQSRKEPMPDVVTMLFQKVPEKPVWPAESNQHLLELAQRVERKKHGLRQQQFLLGFWSQWLEPAFAEHEAQQQWRKLVEDTIEQALTEYRRDFLDHPHHYHTFQIALLNLLSLLEIPSLARFLTTTRRVMTWPVRKMLSLGQGRFKSSPDQEIGLLNQIGEHTLIRLADTLLEKTESETLQANWWRETAIGLRQNRGNLLHGYQTAVLTYHSAFQQDVDAAAHKLYHKLEDQPLVLNSLRATRISTDAGAILLAIQAGGIGIHDLVLTPMMLTVTSLLTESALGNYMRRVEAELKQHQFHTVKSDLFQRYLRDRLYQLPLQIHSPTRFNISEEQCRIAEQTLKEKKHGLRLL